MAQSVASQEYVFIHELTQPMYMELYALLHDPETSKWLGDGSPWNDDDVVKLCQFSASDRTKPWSAREYFYWAIVSEHHVIGIIGIHPAPARMVSSGQGSSSTNATPKAQRALQLMFAIAPEKRGQSRASRAVSDILADPRVRDDPRALYAIARLDNAPSLRTLEKIALKGLMRKEPRDIIIKRVHYAVFKRIDNYAGSS